MMIKLIGTTRNMNKWERLAVGCGSSNQERKRPNSQRVSTVSQRKGGGNRPLAWGIIKEEEADTGHSAFNLNI